MKIHRAFSKLALVAISLFAFCPTYAAANEAPVCSGSFEDHQVNTGMYADVGFYLYDFCYDPDGDGIQISSIQWGPGYQMGSDFALLYQIALGTETIPITVIDSEGNQTVFYWTVYRYGS